MVQVVSYLIGIIGLSYWVSCNLKKAQIPPQKSGAQALDNWIKNFKFHSSLELKGDIQIPDYKFYGQLIELILAMARKYGGSFEKNLLNIRLSLESDSQFEKRCNDLLLGTCLQMFMMFLLTWGFIHFSLVILEIKTPIKELIYIGLWQIFGMCLLPLFINILRKHFFQDIGKLWETIYTLKSLVGAPISRSEIYGYADLVGLARLKNKRLIPMVNQLLETCQKVLKQGGCYELEVDKIMREVQFEETRIFALFEKQLNALKLCILSLFFVPSFLAFIYVLASDFVELM